MTDMKPIHPSFDLQRSEVVDEYRSTVALYRHRKTGAELMFCRNDDPNKVFCVGFRTVPSDSTGVFHIIEHSVLCGSGNFPLKAPFNVAMEGSLQTFLNAFTMPDATIYPVATLNHAEFETLSKIYLDAVFNAFISRRALEQEGTCLELRDLDGDLKFGGVVYNEMKGANATPSRKLWRETVRSVCPVGPYSCDSGGDPEEIRKLSYDQFRSEYLRCYHPSNCKLFVYGDADEERTLTLVDEFLSPFERATAQPSVEKQPRFSAPQRREVHFNPAKPKLGDREHVVTVAWLLEEPSNATEAFIAQVVGELLIGSSAAPLQKSLIESGLGESPLNYGMQTYLREPVFGVGLVGVRVEDTAAVEKLILDTVAAVAERGFEAELVEATLNSLEFSLREQNYGRTPAGVHLVEEIVPHWLGGRDPVAEMRYEPIVQDLRARLRADSNFFATFVGSHLQNNPHRCTTVFVPDLEIAKKLEERERAELDEWRQRLTRREKTELVSDTWERLRLKESKDSDEALATIPTLALTDLTRRNREFVREVCEIGGVPCVFHPAATRGIVYIDLCFDFSSVPEDLLPMYGVLTGVWSEVGTTSRTYDAFENAVHACTGGIRARHMPHAVLGTSTVRSLVAIRGSALSSQVDAMMALMREMMFHVNLGNRPRISDLVQMWKAGLEKNIAGRGHEMAASMVRAQFNRLERVEQHIQGGANRLHRLRDLVREVQTNWESVEAKLRTVHRNVVARQGMILHIACESADRDRVERSLSALLSDIPAGPKDGARWSDAAPPRAVGLVTPCPINYCALGGDLFRTGYQFHGSARVATALLNNKYLWQEVREKGGAYGVHFGFNNISGEAIFWSYQDPNIQETFKAFLSAPRWLATYDFSDDEIRKAIISVVAELDTPGHVSVEAQQSFSRHLMQVSDEYRNRVRAQLLDTTREDVRAFAQHLQQAVYDPAVAVFGDEGRIRAQVEAGLPFPLEFVRVS